MTAIVYVKGYIIDDATGIKHDVDVPLTNVQAEKADHRQAVVVGGAAGNFAVSGGIAVGDKLEEVLMFVITAGNFTNVVDLTAEFTITGTGQINNTSGTASTSNKLLVRWTKA